MNCIKNIVLEKIARATTTTEKMAEEVDNISNKTKEKGVPVQKNNTNANSSLLISSRRCQNDIITDIKQQHKIVGNVGDGTNDHSVVVIDDGDEHDHHDDSETGAFRFDIEDDIHYYKALNSIDDHREYDYFGLDVQTNTIGGLPYVVDRNRLIVDVGTESNKVFVIKDPDVWMWLCIKCPLSKVRVCKENGEHTLAFMQYKHIVKSLRLFDRAQRMATKTGKKLSKKIQKYRLLLDSDNHDRVAATVQSSNILAMAGNKTALLEKRVKQLEARAQSSINITVRRALTSTDNTMFNYLRYFFIEIERADISLAIF